MHFFNIRNIISCTFVCYLSRGMLEILLHAFFVFYLYRGNIISCIFWYYLYRGMNVKGF